MEQHEATKPLYDQTESTAAPKYCSPIISLIINCRYASAFLCLPLLQLTRDEWWTNKSKHMTVNK